MDQASNAWNRYFLRSLHQENQPAARAGPGSSTVTPFYTLHPVFFPFLSRNFFPAAAFPLLLQLGPFLSAPLVAPFENLVPSLPYNGYSIDTSTLIAILAYALAVRLYAIFLKILVAR